MRGNLPRIHHLCVNRYSVYAWKSNRIHDRSVRFSGQVDWLVENEQRSCRINPSPKGRIARTLSISLARTRPGPEGEGREHPSSDKVEGKSLRPEKRYSFASCPPISFVMNILRIFWAVQVVDSPVMILHGVAKKWQKSFPESPVPCSTQPHPVLVGFSLHLRGQPVRELARKGPYPISFSPRLFSLSRSQLRAVTLRNCRLC